MHFPTDYKVLNERASGCYTRRPGSCCIELHERATAHQLIPFALTMRCSSVRHSTQHRTVPCSSRHTVHAPARAVPNRRYMVVDLWRHETTQLCSFHCILQGHVAGVQAQLDLSARPTFGQCGDGQSTCIHATFSWRWCLASQATCCM